MPHRNNPLLIKLHNTRASGRMALCGYFLTGYPTPEEFFRLVRASDQLDVIEFGIPADDPKLDGPVISHAHETVTHQRGLGAESALALIGGLRHIQQPRFVMTYTEVGRALDGFIRLCVENNIHGMLAPDIDPHEGAYVAALGRAMNIAMFTLLDARDDEETFAHRVELADIVYLKAARGKTGQPADIEGDLGDTIANAIARIRHLDANLPIAVGIGLQEPEQVAALAKLDVDMAIVGTRLVKELEKGEAALVQHISALYQATPYPHNL